ncbi:MAG: CRTAC1 family protein [Acidobacteria bacterium]|nr:CRTAC1 family protein [Acidobacteriota bacterium]
MSYLALCGSLAGAADPAILLSDVTDSWGLGASITYGNTDKNIYILETTGTGAAVLDFDSDGDNDVVVVNGTTLQAGSGNEAPLAKLYRNDGGKFVDVAGASGLDRRGWGQGVCVGDYNNDGNPDLAMGYFGGPALYRNLGGGKFNEVAAKSGLQQDGRWSAACAFLDYDNDGFLDLFFSSYVDLDLAKTPKPGERVDCNWKGIPVMCGPRGLPTARNSLYRNLGNGRFVEVSEKAGIWKPGGRYGLGVTAADFNNDGRTDIYVACDMTPSLLFINQGDGTFDEVGAISGTAFSMDGQLQAGMGVSVADYDGNGFLDIIKTNFSGDLPSLYKNEDGEFFEDVSSRAGLGKNQLLGWGVLFEDFDADSKPDVLIANGHVYPEVDNNAIGETYRQPTILYRNLGSGRFEDVSQSAGPALKVPRAARGMAAGDLDGDGRPEVVIVNVNDKPAVLKNTAKQGNFFWLRLEGTKSNRSAIGARVTITANGITQVREVTGGGSYYSQSDLALYFGLGTAAKIDRFKVRWPSGAVQELKAVSANKRYRLVEGGTLTEIAK